MYDEKVIAEAVKKAIEQLNADENQVKIGVSARHVHLSQQDLETLFGAGHTLTNKKDLSHTF